MKKAAKEIKIAEALRERIISGELKPGSKLPTYDRLEEGYQASRMTLQRAIGKLKDDGYVKGVERQGLFIAEAPPHLNRYGIILPSHERHSKFWASALDAAKNFEAASPLKSFAVYRNIDDDHRSQEEWTRLEGDVREKRLAGLFSTFSTESLQDRSFFEALRIPFVSTGKASFSTAFIKFDFESFVEKALAHFKAKGRRRLAVLARASTDEKAPILAACERQLAASPGEFHCPFRWRVPLGNVEAADHVAQLLLSLPESERPDALLIADDHLVGHAVEGVLASGARVPEDLEIAAHCNWHGRIETPLPMKLLGFDIDKMLLTALEIIDAANAGRKFERANCLKALFQEELSNPKAGAKRR
jgi:DNA-binding LacI/PurR family transcriptional regulator